ncbi:SIMPL domain-containing protein [Olleya sp. 1-3]|uniref:SIMPL domain-containing protein n=1 Tax=Olleya sp. 1-3 TaxID=2058323 RepID=UPI000C3353E3|nr:SIMPL domain-containing protein [Olleya sp. 1-3]PKG49818.1 SIMPL domain-containing protein [Olleya sp. 1-3]
MKYYWLILFVCVTLSSHSQSKSYNSGFLETTVVTDSLVVPDRIYFSILITENDTKGKQSVEELEVKMEVQLKSLGINTAQQLSLSDMSSSFRKYFLRSKDILKNKTYQLLLYDAETAGRVIVALETVGISNVFLLKTEYSKLETLKLELKKQGVLKAKKQAEVMIEALGQTIGKAIYISDSQTLVTAALSGRAAGIKIRGISSSQGYSSFNPVNIDFEKIKIESRVIVNFELK